MKKKKKLKKWQLAMKLAPLYHEITDRRRVKLEYNSLENCIQRLSLAYDEDERFDLVNIAHLYQSIKRKR